MEKNEEAQEMRTQDASTSERELILTTRKLRYGKGALLHAVAFSL